MPNARKIAAFFVRFSNPLASTGKFSQLSHVHLHVTPTTGGRLHPMIVYSLLGLNSWSTAALGYAERSRALGSGRAS